MDKTQHLNAFTNKRVFDFYAANKNISLETMNIIILDILEQLGNDMTKIMSNTVSGEILNYVKDIKYQVTSLHDTMSIKLQEHNQSFLETTKLVIGAASSDNADKISLLLNRNTETFVDKINASIPKTQEDSQRKIQDCLQTFQNTLNTDFKTYLSCNNSDSSLKEFLANLDAKLITLQQPIYTFLSANQDQLTSKINHLREETVSSKVCNDKVMGDLNEFLNKYKSSSQFKGQCSENMLETVLNRMFPTGEVTNTTAFKAAGDFMLKRDGKPSIIIENKMYESNVNVEEIKKFLRDVTLQKTNGIMMSQHSGIVSKRNFFIEIHDGKVLIYMHNVEYSPEKIQMAIDAIDILSAKIEETCNVEEMNGCLISKDTLDKINEQFQTFIAQKEIMLTFIKDSSKKHIALLEELKMPDLSLYLNDKYASIQNQQFACEVCALPFQNKRSLAAHKKIHKGIAKEDDDGPAALPPPIITTPVISVPTAAPVVPAPTGSTSLTTQPLVKSSVGKKVVKSPVMSTLPKPPV